MNLSQLLTECRAQPGATVTEISALERDLGHALPDDYKALLLESNGIEGFLSPDTFIMLWTLDEIRTLNEAYSVKEFIPGVVMLGTNGSDTGYGFLSENHEVHYVSVPLVGMEPAAIERMGSSFRDLLRWARKRAEP